MTHTEMALVWGIALGMSFAMVGGIACIFATLDAILRWWGRR